MRNIMVFLICLFLVGCSDSKGRFEVKNVKLPIRTGTPTEITYQDELVKIDTYTGKVWKLQHGTNNIGNELAEFSLWDELGNTYRVNGKDLRKP